MVNSVQNSDAPFDKPLTAIRSSAGKDVVTVGSDFRLGVTVTNQGSTSAVINVLLNNLSPVLRSWVSVMQERLALGSQESGEVVFQFKIPADALPGTYPFKLLIDAPNHYPDGALRYDQVLQILPASRAVQVSDPTFVVQPATSAAKPIALLPGSAVQVQVWVYNRAERVDRFRLFCTDLPETWFTISYPQGVTSQGLVIEDTSLDLNPGDQGPIFFLITPPLEAIAGSYIPTLRLQSENNSDLVLLDLVYIDVQPVYQLEALIRTLVNRVRRQPGLFDIQFVNSGNIPRTVSLRVNFLDDTDLCTYYLENVQHPVGSNTTQRDDVAPVIQIQPRQTLTQRLQIQPSPPRKRPWFGGGRLINFTVDLEDTAQHPLTTPSLPGFVIWEARPWWQLLALILLGLGCLGALLWLLWWLFLRPPVLPKIVEFFAEDRQYAAVRGDAIRLGFVINQPRRLQTLTIVGLSPEGQAVTTPLTYDFRQGVPNPLQPNCTVADQQLTCRNILTDARRAGDYRFTLTATAADRQTLVTESRDTPIVTIQPIPLPQIVAFSSTQPTYLEPVSSGQPAATEAQAAATAQNGVIRLNWQIDHPDQIQAIEWIGRSPDGVVLSPLQRFDWSQGIPAMLQPFCAMQTQLVCQAVPTSATRSGTYVFELTAIPKTAPADAPPPNQPGTTLKSDPIQILPRLPEILSFRVNGRDAKPKYVIAVDQNQPPPKFVLSWQVKNYPGVTVELLPAPGMVPLTGSVALPLSPQPGSMVIALQVKNAAGQQVMRSISVETFDPTPNADASTDANQGEGAGQDSNAPPRLDAPVPTHPDRLAPTELPPQFN